LEFTQNFLLSPLSKHYPPSLLFKFLQVSAKMCFFFSE
jgi:hypothetical protein